MGALLHDDRLNTGLARAFLDSDEGDIPIVLLLRPIIALALALLFDEVVGRARLSLWASLDCGFCDDGLTILVVLDVSCVCSDSSDLPVRDEDLPIGDWIANVSVGNGRSAPDAVAMKSCSGFLVGE